MVWIIVAAPASAIAAYYGVLAAHMWLRSRTVLGPMPPAARVTLRTLLDVSRQGDGLRLMRLTLFYGGLGALVVVIAARAWPGLVVAAAPLVLIAWMDLRTTTVPVVLVLGTSTHSSIRRQRAIKHRLAPLRVMSLLDIDVPWDASLTNEMALDCFRTTNDDDWWPVITRLMGMAPILVIDAAAEGAAILREAQYALGSDLWRKCLFLTPANGSAPILDHLLPIPGVQRQALRIVQYEEAPHALAAMVAQLGQRRARKPWLVLRRCRKVGIPAAFAEREKSAASTRTVSAERRFADHAGHPLSRAAWDAAREAEQRYLDRGDRQALDSAVAAWLCMVEHPSFASASAAFRVRALRSAGTVLLRRHDAGGPVGDLDRALELREEAIDSAGPSSPELPAALDNLASALLARFGLRANSADLDEAIRLSRQALNATPADSPLVSGFRHNLAAGLLARFESRGRPADLDEAIQSARQVVEGTPPGTPERPGCLNILGVLFRHRYELMSDKADLDAAIQLLRQALQAMPPLSSDLPVLLSNLGSVMYLRYAHMGTQADLDDEIQLCQRALHATPPGSPRRPGFLHNLGSALYQRAAIRRDEEELEAAIQTSRQAVNETPPDSPDLPAYLLGLGSSLMGRLEILGRETDLDEVIRIFRQALEATPPDSNGLPEILHHLVIALSLTGREPELDEAMRTLRRALKATPPDSAVLPPRLASLAKALRNRYARTRRRADLNEGIGLFRRACESGALSSLPAVLVAATDWGRWAIERGQWAEAVEATAHGLAVAHRLQARQIYRAHKETWLDGLQALPALAAYALARLGRCEDAAAAIEGGRARLLAEALQRRRRDLEQLTALGRGDLYRRYREAVETQERLIKLARPGAVQPVSPMNRATPDAIAAANAAVDRVVADIQAVPGFADFLAEPTFPQIQAAAGGTPLAYLLATAAGGLALVVDRAAVEPIWLDALTDAALLEWLRGLPDAATRSEMRDSITKPAEDLQGSAPGGWLANYLTWQDKGTPGARAGWLAAMDEVTRQLWVAIMEPLAAVLHRQPVERSAVPAVTLIPNGLLALLPLHAAWTADPAAKTGRRYFLDALTVNYAPSALALGHARAAAGAPADHLLAVEEPLAPGAGRLPAAHAEVAAVAALFATPVVLAGAAATRQAVRAAIPQARVLHFCCHGTNDWLSSLESGLLMAADDTGKEVLLTVRDFLESAPANGRLATLSACETGITGTRVPNEMVTLPSALLQAGFGGVAASLWSVADLSTAMLMERFYRGWREDGLPPAQALRAAQQWLRDTTNHEKAEYYKRYIPSPSPGRTPEGPAADFLSRVTNRGPDRRDFAHPFYWGAFYLTGV